LKIYVLLGTEKPPTIRYNSDDPCYISGQKTAPSHQLSKNIKLKFKNTILHVDFCGWETWLISAVKATIYIAGIRESGAEENIWTEDG
jgi:hypothetical protein